MKTTDARDLQHLTLEQQQQVAAGQAAQQKAHKEMSKERAAASYRTMDVPCATLNTGAKIPVIGLGTWKSAPGAVKEAVKAAIHAGYRHIDCAAIYGNEAEVGDALSEILAEGVVTRDQLFITTKLWNSEHAKDRAQAACRKSLKDLKLDYVDLYLIHWPVTGVPGATVSPPLSETWGALEGLMEEGLVRAIGVSNFSRPKLEALMKGAKVQPAVLQVEAHPYWRNQSLLDWAHSAGIHVTAYSPLGSPDSADMLKREFTPSLMQDPVVTGIAEKMGKNPGQVLIRWGVQHGTSVLPKSSNPGRIASNLEVLDWSLSDDDMTALSKLEVQCRMVDGTMWINKEGPYRSLSDLWDDPEEDRRRQQLVKSTYKRLDAQMPTAKLSTGAHIPLIGLGTWKSEPGQVKQAVKAAIRAGYRHIDCAAAYKNEAEVGSALQEMFGEGVVQREQLWITSKLWNSEHGADQAPAALRKTLKDLQLDYLDLYLIHWPATGRPGATVSPPLSETWGALEGLVQEGLVRAIGVSNFSRPKLGALMKGAKVQPAVLQVEAHPYWRNQSLLDWAHSVGIHVTAYSPLGSPDSAVMMKRGGDVPRLMEDPVVKDIASKMDKDPGQVLIRWGVQHGTSVVPKSTNPARIASNLEVLDWSLSDKDMTALSNLKFQHRMLPGTFLVSPEGPYKTVQDLWEDTPAEAPAGSV